MLPLPENLFEKLVASTVAEPVESPLREPTHVKHDPYVLTQAILERLG